MSQTIASAHTFMLNFKKTCWGLLAVMTVGAAEPAWAAATDVQPAVKPDVARIFNGVPTSIQLAVWAAIADGQTTSQRTLLAADPDLASVFSGNGIPTSIQLKELNPTWRAMSTNGQLEIGNFQTFVGAFAGGGFATSYYTQGKTISIGSETYIVAYSLLSLVDKLTPETPLNLSLLNLKTIGSMSNIRVFDVAKETKVLEKQLAALQLSNVFDPTAKPDEKPPETTPPATPPEVKPPTVKPPVRRKRRIIRRRNT